MIQQAVVSQKCNSKILRPGFTLIELMIAIVIIGILAGGSIYVAMTVMENARKTATKTTLQTISMQLLNYKSEKGDYPQSLQELVKAGFLKRPQLRDGFDKPIVYHLTPDGDKPYELYSYGPQGKGGGKASRMTSGM